MLSLSRRALAHAGRRRAYSTALPALPPTSEWPKLFPAKTIAVRDRVTTSNPETAAKLAEAFVPEGSKDQVIVEAFPGPGALTRALLELPHERVRKIIVLEDHEPFLDHLRPLEQDSRVQLIAKNAAAWTTYQSIYDEKLLDDSLTQPWDAGVHPNLQFIGQIPHSIPGEQLVSQFFRCIPDGSWMFKHGRVPMKLLMTDWMWRRVSATTKQSERCKVSVMAEAAAEYESAISPEELMPYREHFHPIPSMIAMNTTRRSDVRKAGQPMVALNITPRAKPLIKKGLLEKWDYVLRRLFVKKGQSLKRSITNVGPGSEDLLSRVIDPSLPEEKRVDPDRIIRQMTVEDWAVLCNAFDEWPFAPEDLLIHDAFNRED